MHNLTSVHGTGFDKKISCKGLMYSELCQQTTTLQ